VCCIVLQRVAACCNVLQCEVVHCSVLQCVAMRCIVLQCVVAVLCNGSKYTHTHTLAERETNGTWTVWGACFEHTLRLTRTCAHTHTYRYAYTYTRTPCRERDHPLRFTRARAHTYTYIYTYTYTHTLQRERPMGHGRCGERVANTPLDLPNNRGGYTLGLLYKSKSIDV